MAAGRVHVLLGVVYEVEDEQIKQARVFFEMPVLLKQLDVQMEAGQRGWLGAGLRAKRRWGFGDLIIRTLVSEN